MRSSRSSSRRLGAALAFAALGLGLGLALWALFIEPAPRRAEPLEPRGDAPARGATSDRQVSPRATPGSPVGSRGPLPGALGSASVAAGRQESPHREPHPLDDAHRRIQRENQLIQAANDAMDRGRVEDLRRVLEVYREHDPDDQSGLQLGYGVIAECLEHPGPVSRASGERFIAEHRVSSLRRFVRRHCLGGS